MKCEFKTIAIDELSLIKPLWEKLNQMHLNDSKYFKDHYRTFTFEERCRKFFETDKDMIRIEIIEDNGLTVGYCISSIITETGEIESLFIEEEYRKSGFGSRLVENAVKWMKEKKCRNITVSVIAGHEYVFGFYMKHNFYPRSTRLQLKD